jgi:hypothetical protein
MQGPGFHEPVVDTAKASRLSFRLLESTLKLRVGCAKILDLIGSALQKDDFGGLLARRRKDFLDTRVRIPEVVPSFLLGFDALSTHCFLAIFTRTRVEVTRLKFLVILIIFLLSNAPSPTSSRSARGRRDRVVAMASPGTGLLVVQTRRRGLGTAVTTALTRRHIWCATRHELVGRQMASREGHAIGRSEGPVRGLSGCGGIAGIRGIAIGKLQRVHLKSGRRHRVAKAH